MIQVLSLLKEIEEREDYTCEEQVVPIFSHAPGSMWPTSAMLT